ncbi:MAG: RNA 3'-terminal phosphate cyclase [Syntrophobacteraceae bacterium]
MIEIDGAMHSGSGTLVRCAAALATVLGEPLHLVRIREKRDKPGLRPQHLQAIRACCALSGGALEGDVVGSREISYHPKHPPKGGIYDWDIGTAGSATMLAFCLLTPALFASAACRFSLTGGLFQDHAPTAFHMKEVLLPQIRRMGAVVELEMVRPGFVPQGQGELQLRVEPLRRPLSAFECPRQGRVTAVRGIALASHLGPQQVAGRMAEHGRLLLAKRGFEAQIHCMDDSSAVQKGAALFIRAQSDTGAILGADQAGKRGRRSESIAEFVVRCLLEDLATGASVDRFLADQLILTAALAAGETVYRIPGMTEHVESNLWLVNRVLGARSSVQGGLLTIRGVAYFPPAT